MSSKINAIKQILSFMLSLALVLGVFPMLSTTVSAAGGTITIDLDDGSVTDTSGDTNFDNLDRSYIKILDPDTTKTVVIKGDGTNGGAGRSIEIIGITDIIIEDGTIMQGRSNAETLILTGGSIITGGGSNITITGRYGGGIFSPVGDITIDGTLGDIIVIGSAYRGITVGGNLDIVGTVGDIRGGSFGISGGDGIYAGGSIDISGTVGTITGGNGDDNGGNGILTYGGLDISGTVGNITGGNSLSGGSSFSGGRGIRSTNKPVVITGKIGIISGGTGATNGKDIGVGNSSYMVFQHDATQVVDPANCTAVGHTLDFDYGTTNLDGTEKNVPQVAYVSTGLELSKIPTPIKTGHVFEGWYKEAAFQNKWNTSDTISADETLFVKLTPPPAVVTDVTVIPNPVTVEKGSSVSFVAIVNGSNLTDTSVTWSVSGNTSADTDINTTDGAFAVGTDESAPTLTVTATSNQDPSKSGTAVVTVIDMSVVALPTATPRGGEVEAGTTVRLKCVRGAVVHYTTDGSTPTVSSDVYGAPITVDSAMTIKAIAVQTGMANSGVMIESYTIKSGGIIIPPPAITVEPSVTVSAPMNLDLNGTKQGIFSVSLGMSGNVGDTKADYAEITVDNPAVASVSSDEVFDHETIVVTGESVGTAVVTVRFYDAADNEMLVPNSSFTVNVSNSYRAPSGGGSSSSGGSSKADVALTVGGGSSTSQTSKPVTKAEAEKAFNDATAKLPAGSTGVTVTLKNSGTITSEVLKHLEQKAIEQGLALTLNLDTVVGNRVIGRITLRGGVGAEGFAAGFNQSRAEKIAARFRKFFANPLTAVSLNQQGEFASAVSVAVTLPEGMTGENLAVYSYDMTTNTYKKLDTKAWVDKNGYVHFDTNIGGDFVISNGELTK